MNTIKSTIDKNGRVLIPLHFRKSLLLEPGDEVILYQEGTELKMRSFQDSLSKARQILKQYNKDDLDLISMLVQERREENKDA